MIEFNRDAYKDLLLWKEKNNKLEFGNKKVLRLDGTRRVGKTTLAKKFAKENYNEVTYINLLDNTEKKASVREFRRSFEIGENTLQERVKKYNSKFEDNKDNILIIDEIQDDVNVFNSIRAFAQTMNCDVLVSGSYLGKTLNTNYWASAGNYISLNLDVISFPEFLEIFNKRKVYNDLDVLGKSESKDYAEINKYFELYRLVGGYPEVILEYMDSKDITKLDSVLDNIFYLFCMESANYLEDIEDKFIFTKLIRAIVQILNNEKKGLSDRSFSGELQKITSKYTDTNLTKKEITNALNWLIMARVILPCGKAVNCNLNTIKDNSRFYINDLGLARYFYKKFNISDSDTLGMLNELFVAKVIHSKENSVNSDMLKYPCYGIIDDNEIDFITRSRLDNKIYGIEVKTSNNATKSLDLMLNKGLFDYGMAVKGVISGGESNIENKYTIPIVMFPRFEFTLGGKSLLDLPSIDFNM